MNRFCTIDTQILESYTHLKNKDHLKCCDAWPEVWDDLKAIMKEEAINNVMSMNKRYDWTQYITNYVQDLELELGNARVKDNSYYYKQIMYCRELCEYCGSEQLMRENTYRAITDFSFALRDYEQSECEFKAMIKNDPTFDWAYIAWLDCYAWKLDEPRNDITEEY